MNNEQLVFVVVCSDALTPAGKPEFSHELPAGCEGEIYAASFCNLYGFADVPSNELIGCALLFKVSMPFATEEESGAVKLQPL